MNSKMRNIKKKHSKAKERLKQKRKKGLAIKAALMEQRRLKRKPKNHLLNTSNVK